MSGFNGVDLGALTGPGGSGIAGSKDVTGLVHAGVNHISYKPQRAYMAGTFFLSTKPLESYPHRDSGLNARIVDWRDYLTTMAVDQARQTMQTMRGTDPNRPIKVMAAADRSVYAPLMADYGGFGHNTGDEAFFVPGTSAWAILTESVPLPSPRLPCWTRTVTTGGLAGSPFPA